MDYNGLHIITTNYNSLQSITIPILSHFQDIKALLDLFRLRIKEQRIKFIYLSFNRTKKHSHNPDRIHTNHQ